jgi:hypothetical protein
VLFSSLTPKPLAARLAAKVLARYAQKTTVAK